MEIKEFIANLSRSNFLLSVDDGKLNLTGDKKKLSKAEIDGIKSNKEVIDYIRANKNEIIEHLTLYSDISSVKKSKNISSIYRLSGLQQGMLFHDLYEGETEAYKVQFSCDLSHLNEEAFINSWKYLLQRHTILRSGFYYDSFNVPVQCVYNDVELPVEILDFRSMNEEDRNIAINEYAAVDVRRSFDFKTPPLMRVGLLRLTDSVHRMHWTSHHILFDGWSLPILMEEFLSTYELLIAGKELKATAEDKYEDYIRYINRVDKIKEEVHWRNYLTGVEHGTLLPFVKTTTDRTKGIGAYQSVHLNIDITITQAIQEFAQSNRLTVNTIIQGVWSLLLHRYTGSDNIVFGVVVSGRPEDLPGVEQRVGMYINTLPLHAIIQSGQQIIDWLQNLQTEQIISRQYQHTPLSDTQQWAGVQGDFFDSLLVFENYPVNKVFKSKKWSIGIENVRITDSTNYPLTILVNNADQLSIQFIYNKEILDEVHINNIRDHFKIVLQQIVEGTVSKAGEINLITKAEEHQLLHEFNNVAIDYPKDKTIVNFIEDQVMLIPNAIAVVYDEKEISYRQLNERSNQLAHHLKSKGVHADMLVPICIERGLEMIIGILGILKAGGAYVPIDPEYPFERIRYVIEDTNATLVISSPESSLKLQQCKDIDVIMLTGNHELITNERTENPNTVISPNDLAYIIYTSGSTGKPKGVMIQHNNVTRLFKTASPVYDFHERDVWSMFHSFCFDFSVWEIFGALFYGGRLVIIPQQAIRDSALFLELLLKENVTVLNQTPSAFYVLQDYITNKGVAKPPVRYLIFGGEALNPPKLKPWKELYNNDCRIVNMYGITETTVHVTYQQIDWQHINDKHSVIGRPIPTLSCYILDQHQRLVPIGIPGELWIGGAGLARGYLNLPELTAEKFVKNPLGEAGDVRLYKTGDIGCWLSDGTIEYLGRMDDQVKIRGYRIELGEIENTLQQSGLVRHVVVLAKKDRGGNSRLVGYAMADGKFDQDAILNYLKSKLPGYMVPALWIELDNLPLTPNGKVDKKALPDPDAIDLFSINYEAPRNNLEQKLAQIWQELLGIEKVGINNNFFEIGGHSLLAMRVISLMRRRLETEVGIKDLFTHPTIAELADYIRLQSGETLLPQIIVQSRPANIPLSFSQERLWFIDQLEGSRQYHMPAVLRIKGNLNIDALRNALNDIVNRHEVLRSVILKKDGRPYQLPKEINQWNLELVDGSTYVERENDLKNFVQELIQKPFNLSEDFMLRAHLITVGWQDFVLVITLHHIASDGWSRSILVKEIVELYASHKKGSIANLSPLPIQYADYAIWQRSYFQEAVLEKKMGYWKKQLDGTATLNLPTDFTRSAIQNTKGASIGLKISQDVSEKISELSKAQGTTLYMTLLSVFKILLYRYTGQHDICVGTGIAGRQQQETEGLIGFFVNTLAMRSQVYGDTSYSEFLQAVKATTLEAYHHQEVPFEKIVDAVVTERDLSRNPLLQVTFIVQNTPDIPQLVLDEVELSVIGFDHITSRFDISFSVKPTANGLEFLVEYCADLFYPETIERMVGHYNHLLAAVLANPDQNIDSLLLITTEEKRQLTSFSNSGFTTQPSGETLVSLFEKQVYETPDAIALVFQNQTFTYKVLNEKANQLAHFLSALGVKREMLVPICIERSPEMIVGILGTLKAGGAYVPIDPSYPKDRIDFMLEDTGATLVVSSSNGSEKLVEQSGVSILRLDGRDKGLIDTQPATNLPVTINNNQLAYVIYTSGSTGKPKGVLIEHKSVTNLIERQTGYFGIDSTERIIQFSNYCFDASVEQIFLALSNGAALVLFEEDFQLNPEGFSMFLNDAGVTHLHSTPFFLENLFPEKCGALRRVIAAGDLCRRELVNKWKSVANFYNKYGPTETAISVAEYKVEPGSLKSTTSVPIGKPLPNVSIYVLDKNYSLCPIGIPGEIYIGGIQVARGYLNRPELTLEKFIEAPTSSLPPSRLYKTGDLGRWLTDGNLEYLGRMDDQVKIHGYRIETGEIESVLNAMQSVDNSCVVVKEDKDTRNTRLVAYYLPNRSAVKLIEGQLYNEQVASWKEIHENEYTSANENSENPEFDILGWNDSFTRTPIPEAHMREWLADIVDVIFSDKVERVLEIGSGSGLIYYQLAGKVEKYIGTDFSKTSINLINNRISLGLRDYGPTELQVAAAHEVTVKDTEAIDTIVLNSIIQYFPGEDYLSTVIANSISILKNKGRIIIGDVRDLRTLKLFKARLKLERLPELVSLAEFDWSLEQDILNEEELCFSPEYFYALKTKYPAITHVEIVWKQGLFVNELTAYRYTVVIYVGVEKEVFTPDWQIWNATEGSAKIIAQFEKAVPVIAIKQVPNPRLGRETELFKALKNSSVKNVSELLEVIDPTDTLDEVNKLLSTAVTKGYSYKLLLDEDPLKLNLLIELSPADRFIRHIFKENSTDAGSRQLTNIPLFNDICSRLQKDIRNRMVESLPEYMIPSKFVAIQKMPLNSNGKIDRKFLSVIENKDVGHRTDYQAPGNELEKAIADIWKNLLNIEQVGINDNFFQLGGHSLMAVRVISSIRKELNVEVMIRDLFSYPTISELAHHLETLGKGSSLPPITIEPRPEHIPLSFSQERLWFMDQLHGSAQYHVPTVLQLTGNLEVDGLRFALQQMANRHQILRTVIRENKGQGYQHILDENGMQLSVTDGMRYENDKAGLQAYIQSLLNAPFDISQHHMVRAELIKQHTDAHLLVITMHHIASDKWSSSIFVKEVVALYDSYVQKRPAALLPLPIQYVDYAIWQRRHITTDSLDEKLAYWTEKLIGVEPLELPVDYPRPLVPNNNGNITVFSIDKQLSTRLNDLSRQQESTLFMTLLAAFKILLHRYSGQDDICVGTSTAGRQQHEVENLIGFFVNILALRTTVNSSASFEALLQQVKQTTLEAYSHQEVPFEKVVDAVVEERNMSRTPLFQVMLVMLNTPEVSKIELEGLTLSGVGFEINTSKYDITFFVNETPEGISGSIEYSTELFSEQTIRRMATHFNQLLKSIVINPQQTIADLTFLSKAEEQQLLIAFNNTATDYPQTSTIAALFEAQVMRTPLSTAIRFEDERITYQQLNERCNQVANYLLAKGIRPGTNIGLLSNRCTEMIIAMLGIVKAGCAYVPINTDYPEARINFIIEDAAIEHVVFTSKELLQTTGLQRLNGIYINDVLDSATTSPTLSTTADAYVYIMFTSGTTGRPKGIAVSHQNTTKLVYDDGPIRIAPEDSVLQWSNYSFDGSTYDIYSSLLSGATLCLIRENQVADADELARIIQQKNITVCFITTALFNTMIDVQATALKGLRKILFGGEMASVHHVKKALSLLGPDKIVHVYGPTETTVYASSYPVNQIEAGTGIPIGKPLSNTQLYVLDNGMHLVPVGVPGELYIGGHGVSLGYVNNEALSNEKFITNPFTGNSNDRLYQTGDMVRWLPDGNIEYLNRKDYQVKIRGFRIELSEIEAVLQQLETVRYAIVIANTDQQGTKRLIGYVVPNEGYDKQLTQQHLKNTLPEYMVPAMLLEIAELPLNANGKIDRKALPDPQENDTATGEFIAPSSHTEQVLAAIWQNLLDVDTIGVHDNFFEIGGDSLLAIRVVSAIRKELAAEVSISSFFEHQTIATLASHIETNTKSAALPPIIPAARPAKIPLSFSQQRLWFIHKLEGSTQYHIPAVLRLKGKLNQQALQYALSTIINRHEVLRTIFPEQGGEPWQQVKDADNWSLTVTDGASLFQDIPALQKHIQQIINAPFDLSADTMLRADLITLAETENILIINLHHIASDGWSRSILVREIAELYTAFEQGRQPALPPLPVQYADFSIWQQNYLQGELLNKKLGYWVNKLKNVAPIQIPADFMRPPLQTSRGSSAVFSVEKETTIALQQIGQQHNSTLFMTLLTALKVLLYRYIGNTDVCVGTASAGRQQQEVEGLIGFFVNTLALRSVVDPDDTFASLLKQVKQTTVEAYEHQDVPFEKIVDAITIKRDRSRNPVFQVMFVLQNTPDVPDIKLGNLTLSGENYVHNTAQFDLSFSITEHSGGLAGAVVYNADIYLPETINRLLTHFHQLVHSIIASPHKKISKLEILSPQEKHQLLIDFNNTEANFPLDKTVIDLFEQQAQQTPDATAIIFENQQLTYQQLNDRANQLAHYLHSKGVTAEMLVPIFIERSPDMIIGILGILKAGAAYVPVDPDYPAERISFMLQDVAATLLITSSQSSQKLPAAVADVTDVIMLDKDAETISQQPSANLSVPVKANQLAYIIYTSGSTGKPKGVMIEHHNMYSFLCWCRQEFASSHFQIAYATTSMCFDLSVFELFYPLTIGKPVRILENGLAIKNVLHQDAAVLINTVPSVIDNLLKTGANLDNISIINMAGEPIPPHIVQALDTNAVEVRNLYGPTEDTTYSTVYRLSKGKPVLIGKPISNKVIYIVDATLQIVPVGVAGEIYIAGDGLARGYLNRPELTAERFVPNPCNKTPGAKMYRTGDIGRWLPDGNIEYIGRADDQVKISGYRIELGEIETVLQQSGLVAQSVVIAKANADGTKQLVGYIVAGNSFKREAVLAYLKAMLPEYMVPTVWIKLESLPLTANGKVDKKALPDAGEQLSTPYAAPRNQTESVLAEIWQELLQTDKVGIHDNFFELGGHSLLAMRVIAAIHKQLKVELAVKDIFQADTISELSKYVDVQMYHQQPQNADEFELMVI